MTGQSLLRWGLIHDQAFFSNYLLSHMMIDVRMSGCIYGYSILFKVRYFRSLPVVIDGVRHGASCVIEPTLQKSAGR